MLRVIRRLLFELSSHLTSESPIEFWRAAATEEQNQQTKRMMVPIRGSQVKIANLGLVFLTCEVISNSII